MTNNETPTRRCELCLSPSSLALTFSRTYICCEPCSLLPPSTQLAMQRLCQNMLARLAAIESDLAALKRSPLPIWPIETVLSPSYGDAAEDINELQDVDPSVLAAVFSDSEPPGPTPAEPAPGQVHSAQLNPRLCAQCGEPAQRALKSVWLCARCDDGTGRAKGEPDSSRTIGFIVNGQIHHAHTRATETLSDAKTRALAATRNTGRHRADWELRDMMGVLVDEARLCGEFADGEQFYLTLHVGFGGQDEGARNDG